VSPPSGAWSVRLASASLASTQSSPRACLPSTPTLSSAPTVRFIRAPSLPPSRRADELVRARQAVVVAAAVAAGRLASFSHPDSTSRCPGGGSQQGALLTQSWFRQVLVLHPPTMISTKARALVAGSLKIVRHTGPLSSSSKTQSPVNSRLSSNAVECLRECPSEPPPLTPCSIITPPVLPYTWCTPGIPSELPSLPPINLHQNHLNSCSPSPASIHLPWLQKEDTGLTRCQLLLSEVFS